MKTEVILFSRNSPVNSGMIELNPFKSGLPKLVIESTSTIFGLIDESMLKELHEDEVHFNFLGKKHPRIPLTKYLNNKSEKVVFLDGSNYKQYGQLKRSIKDSLKKASYLNLSLLCFISVSKEIFTEAKEDIVFTFSSDEMKNGRYHTPILNLIKPIITRIDLKQNYIGNSESCVLVRQKIGIASRFDFPVLITGDTGTGKEVVARSIHQCSDRHEKPFISINCSAIPADLFESEIFGYVKGAFSGAGNDKEGLWETARDGTLFLDEIGDLSIGHQAKILRALQENVIRRVGSTTDSKVNARIIAATNKKIDASGENSFREDLYYRLSTFVIHTPPLNEHPEDIPEMARSIWEGIMADLKAKVKYCKLSEDVINQLRYFQWPGNVRSLKHFLQQLSAYFGSETITTEHLHVLRQQEMDNYFKLNDFSGNGAPEKNIDIEKAVYKMEYLLKAALYSEDKEQRRKLFQSVSDCIAEINS